LLGIGWEFYHFGADGGTYVAVTLVGAIGLVNLWLGVRGLLALRERAQNRLRVDSISVVLGLVDGTSLRYEWRNAHTKVALYTLNNGPNDGGPRAYLALPGRKWVGLTYPTAVHVLDLAREAGVSISPRKYRIKYRGPATCYILRGTA